MPPVVILHSRNRWRIPAALRAGRAGLPGTRSFAHCFRIVGGSLPGSSPPASMPQVQKELRQCRHPLRRGRRPAPCVALHPRVDTAWQHTDSNSFRSPLLHICPGKLQTCTCRRTGIHWSVHSHDIPVASQPAEYYRGFSITASRINMPAAAVLIVPAGRHRDKQPFAPQRKRLPQKGSALFTWSEVNM